MTPLLGDFAVVATGGLAARIIRWGTDSTVNHAFVYVGGGQIVEANPGGAVLSPAANYPHALWSTGTLDLDDLTRRRIVSAAMHLVGTGYGWLDIVAISLAQKRTGRLLNSRSWVARRISSLHTAICSQLVDLAYQRGGVELFDDGRLPGLVSPGDLLDVIDTPRDMRDAA